MQNTKQLVKRLRELEKHALEYGIIRSWEISTVKEMRQESYECYLDSHINYLENCIYQYQKKGGKK